jgi:Fe-S-cluster-containing hydrogenase component 2
MIPGFDRARCLGRSNCAVVGPADAIELRSRTMEVVPPLTGEDLTEVSMAAKVQITRPDDQRGAGHP